MPKLLAEYEVAVGSREKNIAATVDIQQKTLARRSPGFFQYTKKPISRKIKP